MTARWLDAEAERDAAIEEATQAIFALQQTRKELHEQTRYRCVCQCAEANQVELQASTGLLDPHMVAEFALIKERNGTSWRWSSSGARLCCPQRRCCLCDTLMTKDGVHTPDQILRHVGEIAQVAWQAIADSLFNHQAVDAASIAMLSDVKLAVLEHFATLIPKQDAHLYDELHLLYTQVARHEKRAARMAEQMQDLMCKAEELQEQLERSEAQVQLLRAHGSCKAQALTSVDAACETDANATRSEAQSLDMIRNLEQRLNERDGYIQQLLQMIETQAEVIAAHPRPVAHDSDGDYSVYRDPDAMDCLDEYDEFEADDSNPDPNVFEDALQPRCSRSGARHPSTRCSDDRLVSCATNDAATQCDNDMSHERATSSEAIAVLQAQLAMYVQYSKRKQERGEATSGCNLGREYERAA